MVTMTMTMTTFIEDQSNMCQASGPVGMSDGVMTPFQSHGNLLECRALLAQGNLKTHCETTACRELRKVHKLEKKIWNSKMC